MTTADAIDPAPAGGPAVRLVTDHRPVVAGAVLTLALVAVGGLLYFGNAAYDASAPPAAAAADAADPFKPPAAPAGGLRRTEYVLAALSCAMFAIVFAAVGLNLLGKLPKPTAAGRAADARRTLAVFGGLTGLVLMLAGLAFFAYHFGPLVRWLSDKVPPPDAYKPLAAALAFVGGAGLVFLGVQPVRADERDDPALRRLVYGVNAGLTVLLLVAGLLIVNVVVGVRVPNRLDTTATGVYTVELAPATREFLAGLTTPVKLVSVLYDQAGVEEADVRRLVDAARDANPRQVTVETVTQSLTPKRLDDLRRQYTQLDITDFGVLVAVGDDPKQASYLKFADLFTRGAGARGQPGAVQFVGEAKLVQELLALADNKVRPAVYFTTGHGELDADDAGGASPAAARRPAAGLKRALDRRGADAKPLKFDLAKPAVPADAAVVVVADPRTALRPAEVEALRAYFRDPRPDGKKGRLVVLTSPAPNPDGTRVADLGLAGLYADLGVAVGDRYILSESDGRLGYTELVLRPVKTARDAGNPVAAALTQPVIVRNCRPVAPAPAPPGGLTVTTVFADQPPVSWLEEDLPADPGRAFEELLKSPDAQARKSAGAGAFRPLAVTVADAGVGRAVVVGTGDSFADPDPKEPQLRGVGTAADVFGAAVGYLRDRPPAAEVAAKTYGTYTLSPDADAARLLVLPGVIGTAGVAALGVGVWMLRRK